MTTLSKLRTRRDFKTGRRRTPAVELLCEVARTLMWSGTFVRFLRYVLLHSRRLFLGFRKTIKMLVVTFSSFERDTLAGGWWWWWWRWWCWNDGHAGTSVLGAVDRAKTLAHLRTVSYLVVIRVLDPNWFVWRYAVVIISLKESLITPILGDGKLGDETVSRYRHAFWYILCTFDNDNDSAWISDNSLFGLSLLAVWFLHKLNMKMHIRMTSPETVSPFQSGSVVRSVLIPSRDVFL